MRHQRVLGILRYFFLTSSVTGSTTWLDDMKGAAIAGAPAASRGPRNEVLHRPPLMFITLSGLAIKAFTQPFQMATSRPRQPSPGEYVELFMAM